MSLQLKTLSNKKDVAYRRGNKHKFLHLREAYNKLLQNFIKKFHQTDISTTSSTKERWKKVKDALRIKPKSSPVDKANADRLNLEFSSNFSPATGHYSFTENLNIQISDLQFEVTLPMVLHGLNSIKSLASGLDGIPGFLYKKFAELLVMPLYHIFVACLKLGHFPKPWRRANVMPIPKSDTEFRPISLLPVPSKILEK